MRRRPAKDGLPWVRRAAKHHAMRLATVLLVALLALAACAGGPDRASRAAPVLYPNETPGLRAMIDRAAAEHGVPASLVHRVIQRESGYRPDARNGPYYGLMQIAPQTARTMGHDGQPAALLNPETNLRYAVRYLRGAWLLSDGDPSRAVGLYASGYYYEARDRCMLRATGLRATEVRRHCG